MPDALAERFSHLSLPDLLILMSLGEFAPPVSVFVFFYFFFVVHIFFSLIVLHPIHTLFMLWRLPSKFGDYSHDWYSDIHIRLKKQHWLADFFASTKHRSRFRSLRWDSRNSQWKAEPSGCLHFLMMNGCGFFPTYIFHQFGMVTSLHLIFFTGFRRLVHDWISFQKQVPQVQKRISPTIFTNIPFGSRNHHKKTYQFNGTTLNLSKTTMQKMVVSINWMMNRTNL